MHKRLLYIVLIVGLSILLGPSLYAQSAPTVVATGNCGDQEPSYDGCVHVSDQPNATWTLYSDSTLVIEGTGRMGSYVTDYRNMYGSKIKSVHFSAGIEYIGRYALSYLNNLEKITVDPANPYYESPANSNCLIEKQNANDRNVLLFIGNGFIPDGVEVLRDYAICDNYRMTSVTIPRSVKQMGETEPPCGIGHYTPFYLPSLSEIHVQWTSADELPTWMMNPSIYRANQITLYVPCGTKSIYKSALPWKNCKAIIEEGGPVVVNVNDPSMGTVTIELVNE